MKSLICPISNLRIDRNVVRLTGFMMAFMIALYAMTNVIWFVVAITVDYFIRAFTPLTYSPFSAIAYLITRTFNLSPQPINKAPKLFAARVGFLFAFTTVLLFPVLPMGSLVVGLILMSFALLESVLDICMGCLMYTYIVFPLLGNA